MAYFGDAFKKLSIKEGGYVNDKVMLVEKLIEVSVVIIILLGKVGL